LLIALRYITKKARNEEELRLWVSSYCIEERILKPLGISQ
jgi:hypothetical protein